MDTNKQNFRNIGIGLLVVSVFYFIFSSLFNTTLLSIMWLLGFEGSKEAVSLVANSILGQPFYTQLVLFLTPISELIILIWSLIIAILMIKNKRYTPQIKYLFYFIFLKYLVFFILFIPLKNYSDAFTNLIVAVLIYFVVIWKKGLLSKFVYP